MAVRSFLKKKKKKKKSDKEAAEPSGGGGASEGVSSAAPSPTIGKTKRPDANEKLVAASGFDRPASAEPADSSDRASSRVSKDSGSARLEQDLANAEQAAAAVVNASRPRFGGPPAALFRDLSLARHALVEEEGGSARTGVESFDALPRAQWWRMFIDRTHWDNAPTDLPPGKPGLVYDYESSPGNYGGMMHSFETQLATVRIGRNHAGSARDSSDPGRLTARRYKALFDDLRERIIAKRDSGNHFRSIAASWSIGEFNGNRLEAKDGATSFPIGTGGSSLRRLPSADALRELIEDGLVRIDPGDLAEVKRIVGYSGDPPATAFFQDSPSRVEVRSGTLWGVSRLPDGGAEQAADAVFDAYYGALEKAGRDEKARLTAIVEAVRRLHVGHVFPDINLRTNIKIVLNKLLLENGFKPTILSDTGVFRGTHTLAELREAVQEGQEIFVAEIAAQATEQ